MYIVLAIVGNTLWNAIASQFMFWINELIVHYANVSYIQYNTLYVTFYRLTVYKI